MHLGNVTELLLSGNAITSTRGLDRVFSLERLALDENNITQLTHIVGIAKLPFLMNLDMKGNPFEIDGTNFRFIFLLLDVLHPLRLTYFSPPPRPPIFLSFRSYILSCKGL